MTNHIDNLWFELRGTNKRKNALAEGFEFLEYCVLISVGDDGNKYLYLVLKVLN